MVSGGRTGFHYCNGNYAQTFGDLLRKGFDLAPRRVNVVGLGMLGSLTISMLAFGGTLVLLRQLQNRRFWILVAATAFIAAGTAVYSGVQFLTNPLDITISGSDFGEEFPDIVLSIMALMAVYYLERLIRERKGLEKELRLREFSVERVALVGFWIRRDGRILFVNQAACECLGSSRHELLSKTIHDIDPNLTPDEWARKWVSLKQCGSLAFETSYRTKEGQVIPVDVTANHLELDGEEYSCTFARDITEQKRAQETLLASEHALQERVADLEEAQRKLEWQGEDLARLADDLLIAGNEARAADHAKSEFLAAMSHELRTPLNAIIGFSEVIKKETFGPVGSVRYRQYTDDIHNSGQHLLGLINDILDLSKMESGTEKLHENKIETGMEKLHENKIEVPEIIRSALTMVRHRAEQGGIKLETELPDQLPALRADERKVKQILVNLLSNAVKFTDAGGEVTLRAWCRMSSGYVFQIVDTGIGIAPEDIPKALSRFGQVDADLNRQYEGSGLGLPLAKALVELHGGALDLQSEVGVGTTVTVRFPAERIVVSQRDANAVNAADRKAG